ncbi:MAG: hypothetical protein FJ098_00750 [Deltaproteobacteria bacterium]|nr:hypothetical protein [Deltaproteobacteria bacterium]
MSRNLDDILFGPVWGVVVENDDATATGRVWCFIPGVYDPKTPFPILPMGWPGAGGKGQGSQYPPPPVGAQVLIQFIGGVYRGEHVEAVYYTGYYGTEAGVRIGPSGISQGATPEKARQRTVLWEDDKVQVMVVSEADDRRVVIQSKTRGSVIELDAASGPNGNSEVITIESATAIFLYSKGLLDLSADGQVRIQGRRVSSLGKSDI